MLVEWYLREINCPYEVVSVDIKAPISERGSDFLQINPLGRVPALEDEDVRLFESGAILLYLAEKYGKVSDLKARARAAQWVLFANSDFNQALFDRTSHEKSLPLMLDMLEQVLSRQEYLEGDFSVADVAVGSYMLYALELSPMDLSKYPATSKYFKKLSERPAMGETANLPLNPQEASTDAQHHP